MSGYTDDIICEHGVLEPGARLVDKPFTAEELRRVVREFPGQRAGSMGLSAGAARR